MREPVNIIDPNSQRLYWNIYIGLEKEFSRLAELVYIDDAQLTVYSLKIAELLIRTVVEIEAISKDLFVVAGGSLPERNPFFDTDCLAYLEEQWGIEKRVVLVTSPHVYLSKEQKTLLPLKNASRRGKGAWKQAYNAVKHNGRVDVKQGNVGNLMSALAALYLLNIYYKGFSAPFELGDDNAVRSFDASLGSDIFSVCVKDIRNGVSSNGIKTLSGDFGMCTYLFKASEQSAQKLVDGMARAFAPANERLRATIKERGGVKLSESEWKCFQDAELRRAYPEIQRVLDDTYKLIRYEAILNFNQFISREEHFRDEPQTALQRNN